VIIALDLFTNFLLINPPYAPPPPTPPW